MNHNYFETIDTPEKAYFLGFLYADGSISNTTKNKRVKINLAKKDIELLYFFQEQLNRPKNKGIYQYKNEEMVELSIYSAKLVSDLIKLGCCPNKTKTLTFPTLDMVPLDKISNFILGYFDGDGSLSLGSNLNNPRMDITGTEQFLSEMIKYCPETSSGYKIVAEHRTTAVKKIYLSGFKNNYKFFSWLYDNYSGYCLFRKKEKYLFIQNKLLSQ